MRRLALVLVIFAAACSGADTQASTGLPAVSSTSTTSANPTTSTTHPFTDPCDGGQPVGTTDYEAAIDGFTRRYTVYAPAAGGTEPASMLVALHGFSSTRDRFEDKTHLGEAGSAADVIVVMPQGLGPISRWNFTELLAPPDDVSFLAGLIDDVSARYCIGSVHLVGFSNGAALAAVAACALDGITSVTVASGNQLPRLCESPVAIRAFHSLDDLAVPYEGLDIGVFGAFPGVDDTMERWAELAGCDAATDERLSPDVVHRSWQGCITEVSLFVVDTAGHTWPGSTDEGATSSIDATALAIDLVRTTSQTP